MKKLVVSAAVVLAAAVLASCHGGGHPFEDQFNSTSLDTNKWFSAWYTDNISDPPNDNDMTSCWSPSNVSVSNGTLKLELATPDCLGYAYTGSGIVSKGAIAWDPPMRLECRVKFPELFTAYVNWPACWATTSGAFGTCNGWPYGGEFDIAEGLGNTSLQAVTHAAGSCPASDTKTSQTLSTSNDGAFHTYRVDLDAGSGSCNTGYTSVAIQYARDGTTQTSYERCMNVTAGWDFVLQHSTGTFGGSSIGPATMEVDYITVADGH